MEGIYETMYANPNMAGGAVWAFFDQGLLRKSPKSVSKDEFTFYAWPTRDSIYDTSTNEGADGIVYANRVPQVDYYQVRKVYTPVKIMDDTLRYQPGKASFKVKFENRYDFTNLSAVKCRWQLFADTVVLSSGVLPLNCAPHNNITAIINAILPAKPLANYYYLKLMVEDKHHYRFYEKTFPLQVEKNKSIQVIAADISQTKLSENKFTSANFSFEFAKETGKIVLKNGIGDIIVTDGLFARVGRKASVSETAAKNKANAKVKHTLWSPYLLEKPTAQIKVSNAHQLVMNYKYQPDAPKDRSISGDIAYSFSDSGSININYHLVAYGTEEATETGVSFVIPASFTEFRWVGKGPYAAYPGKDRLSEFGIYHLNSNDLYFPGNRESVRCAVFSDAKGAGFALIANDANITVERSAAGIVVSNNASVSGRFNKYNWPADLYSFEKGKGINGSFTLIPFTSATFPQSLKAVFGDVKKVAKAYQPFFYSYDQ